MNENNSGSIEGSSGDLPDSNSFPSSFNPEEEQEAQEDTPPSGNHFLVLKENTSRSKKTRNKLNNSQKTKTKIINKAQVQDIENEEEEEYIKNLRQIFDKFFSTNNHMFYLQLSIAIVSTISSVFFVICTYKISLFHYMNYFDILIIAIYAIEYFVHFILAHHRLFYFISLDSLINLITTVPSVLMFITDDYKGSYLYMFINCSRVLRFLRIFRIFMLYKTEENNVNRQIFMICNTLTQLIFISAGIMQIVEAKEVEKRIKLEANPITKRSLKMRTQFHNYIYFCIISISTEGYGDIILYTPIAKFIFIGVVLLVIILIPYLTNNLIQLMNAQNNYQRQTYKGSKEIPHIVLTGDIGLDSLKSFCQEFFHPDHGAQYRHAVIISKSPPTREMEVFLNEKSIENFLFYIQGNPLNEKDLIRGDISRARACIIFNNKNSKDPHLSDHQSLLIGIFIKKFVINQSISAAEAAASIVDNLVCFNNPNFHLCLQLNKPDSVTHYFNSLQKIYKNKMKSDQFIIIESIKMNLLSKSCLTPGIMALITNLVMSSGDSNDSSESEWLKEYREGRGHEIYRIPLSNYYKKMTFAEICENVYGQAQAIVFGLEIEIFGISTVKLNPTNPMKLYQIISQLKDINSIGGLKESKGGKDNSVASGIIENSKEKIVSGSIENKVRMYAYLICSDKEVADEIANKEKNENTAMQNTAITISQQPDAMLTSFGKTGNTNDAGFSKDGMQSTIGQSTIVDSDSDDDDSDNTENIQLGNCDLDFNKNDYYFNYAPNQFFRNNIEIMQHSIRDSNEIFNHIIICGLHPALIHFILPLRAKYLQEETLKWIVILAPSLPQHLFEALTKFSRIIFIQGSPLLPENLFRANIVNADKAVILSNCDSRNANTSSFGSTSSSTITNISNYSRNEKMLDSETILIYKAIKRCNQNIQIMTELICTSNIEYLLNISNLQKLFVKRNEEVSQYEFTSLYASGEIYTPSIIDRITCQSYYNPHIVTIIELLLGGERALETRKSKKLEEYLRLGNSNLYLVKIPDSYVNESFEEFFYFLIKRHHSIGIALYRKNIIEGYYYVYTNPKKTTLLRDCDFVFVLASSTTVLDLVDDHQSEEEEEEIEDDDEGGEENGEGDPETESSIEDEPVEGLAPNTSTINQVSGLEDNPGIRKRKNKSTKHTTGYSIREVKKNGERSQEIEKLEQRLEGCCQTLSEIAKNLNDVPDFIDDVIEKETENELKVYLMKN